MSSREKFVSKRYVLEPIAKWTTTRWTARARYPHSKNTISGMFLHPSVPEFHPKTSWPTMWRKGFKGQNLGKNWQRHGLVSSISPTSALIDAYISVNGFNHPAMIPLTTVITRATGYGLRWNLNGRYLMTKSKANTHLEISS